MTKTKVIFFGNEKLATGIQSPQPLIKNAVIAAGFEIEQIVTGPLSELAPHQAKLAVLAAYGRLIPQSVLDQFPLGIINIHPSLLPQYRGTTPIEQAMLDGVQKTGVSIMHLTAGMDEGPIYKQKTIHLEGTESKQALVEQLQQLGADLLQEVLPDIATGNLKPRSQPHPDRATYTSKITKENGQLDWNKPADRLEHEIRAYAGWPKSYATIGTIPVIISGAKIAPMGPSSPGKLMPEKNRLFIGTGTDWLEITAIQPQGKKEMPIQAFLAGYRSQLPT
jgi:methionyl-tRNA formyltransferase